MRRDTNINEDRLQWTLLESLGSWECFDLVIHETSCALGTTLFFSFFSFLGVFNPSVAFLTQVISNLQILDNKNLIFKFDSLGKTLEILMN